MKTFELTIKPASDLPDELGYYLTWDWSPKPIVLHWSADYGWRDCGISRPVTYYAGPVPERKGR